MLINVAIRINCYEVLLSSDLCKNSMLIYLYYFIYIERETERDTHTYTHIYISTGLLHKFDIWWSNVSLLSKWTVNNFSWLLFFVRKFLTLTATFSLVLTSKRHLRGFLFNRLSSNYLNRSFCKDFAMPTMFLKAAYGASA